MPHPLLGLLTIFMQIGDCNMEGTVGVLFCAIVLVHLRFTNEIIYLVFENECKQQRSGRLFMKWMLMIHLIYSSLTSSCWNQSAADENLIFPPFAYRATNPRGAMVGQRPHRGRTDWANDRRSHREPSDVAFRSKVWFKFNIYMSGYQHTTRRRARE